MLTFQELFAAGIANSTQRVYKSSEKCYIEFCNVFHLIPFPVSETRLSYFITYLYKEGLKVGTAKSYLSAARHAQIVVGLGDSQISEMPWLECIIKGFKMLSTRTINPLLKLTHSILLVLNSSYNIFCCYINR